MGNQYTLRKNDTKSLTGAGNPGMTLRGEKLSTLKPHSADLLTHSKQHSKFRQMF